MTLTSPTAHPVSRRRHRRRASGSPAPSARTRARRAAGARCRRRLLARYRAPDGIEHRLVRQPGVGGSMLVLDVNGHRCDDRRLVAHLGADEPVSNAALVCAQYVAQAALGRARCRPVEPEDFRVDPCAQEPTIAILRSSEHASAPVDRRGFRYRLERVESGMSIPQLRWCRRASAEALPQPVSVRDVVGRLERYEPVCSITRRALAEHGADARVSITVLRAELQRLLDSPIVLNRSLRLTLLATLAAQELSMSEIAVRCGRVKVDSCGHSSGETSWLARRLGLLPEAGRRAPTPWIHSDVLALIARSGLALSPREVEGDEDPGRPGGCSQG